MSTAVATASPSSTPMEVDDNGGRSRKDAGGDSRRDEPSFDFSSGDTAGEEAVPAPTEGSSSAGGAGDASSPARSDVPGGEGSPADTGRPGADEGTPPVSRSPTPLRRTIAANFSSTSIAASRVSSASVRDTHQGTLGKLPRRRSQARSRVRALGAIHWILAGAVERVLRGKQVIPTMTEFLKSKAALWRLLLSQRNNRADRLRNMYQDQYMKWCLESVTVPRHSFIRPELIVEPSVPSYPVEPLPLVPKTTDWLAEAGLWSVVNHGLDTGSTRSRLATSFLLGPGFSCQSSAAASAGGGNDGSSASESPPDEKRRIVVVPLAWAASDAADRMTSS
ncbi:hypothetical protein GQ600_112 [Phytophthora cactorum]|nr:hypothetical protein GQ600_112 [Phytophthora cactorum]